MPAIDISEEDFKRMQRLAEPLVDTPTTLVTKLIDAFEKSREAQVNHQKSPTDVKVYSFDAPPPLVHVKFISGVIGSVAPRKASWDSMTALCLELMSDHSQDVKFIARTIDLNVVEGKKVDEGYKYLSNKNLSYQGVSAAHAAKVIGKTARHLRVGAFVDFIWREKEEAFAPGQIGALSYDLSN